MSDRGILFLFSILMVIVALGATAWLLISGQAASVDGLFLIAYCLLAAFAFGCYIAYVLHRAMESLHPQPAPKAAAKAAPAAKPTAATSQPVQTS